MNWILFGFKGSGKTYFGKMLAEKTDKQFIDTDQVIIDLFQKMTHEKKSCYEISQERGEAFFRALESEALSTLKDVKDTVIALGGGAVLSTDNEIFLQSLGQLYYLKADKTLIKKRMLNKTIPSFLNLNYPEKSFDLMFKMRKKLYEEIEAKVVVLENKSDTEVLEQIAGLTCGK